MDELQARIEIGRRNINNLRHADDTTLMAENEEELKTLDESKTGAGKSWLKTQNSKNKYYGIWSHHFMQIYGEIMEIVKDFIFLGSKITEDSDHSHEIKRCLLLGRKAITNLGSVLKSTDITLSTKVHIFKAMVFFNSHVWM